MTYIGNWAFNGCTSLKEITFEDGDKTLSLGVNDNTLTSDITGKGLFYDCPLEKLYLGRNLKYSTDSSLGYSPFYGKTNLTELTISSAVTSIPANLLRGYSGLTSLSIPNSVTSIGSSAFYGCSGLTSVTIPSSVTSIGESAFYNCSGLTSVTIPNSVTSIGERAFYNCSGLISVTLGNSVTAIGKYVFSGCYRLKNIKSKTFDIDGLKDSWLSMTEVLAIITPDKIDNDIFDEFDKTTCFENVVVEIEGQTYAIVSAPNFIEINGCLAKDQTMQLIPCNKEAIAKADDKYVMYAYFQGKSVISELNGNGVKFIPTSLWSLNIFEIINQGGTTGDSYRHITMPQAGKLFDEVGLQNIETMQQLKITGDINGTDVMTINRMKALKYLDLSDANIVEGGVTYRENLKTQNNMVGTKFFSDIALETVLLPNTALTIDASAFSGYTSLKNMAIGSATTNINSDAFSGCTGLRIIALENGNDMLNLSADTFSDCPINTLYLGRNLSSTPFQNKTSLTYLTIGNNIKINESAFAKCSQLMSVDIVSDIETVGMNAFTGCLSLTKVNISDVAEWCNIDFRNDYANPLYYAHNLFLNGEKIENLVIPDTVTSIKDYAFSGCRPLTSVSIPNSVTTIGDSAFQGCWGLTSVTISNSVTSIGEFAFLYCIGLTSVNITDIASWCKISFGSPNANPLWHAGNLYLNGEKVENLVIPDTVTSINDYAFYWCKSITSVTIPNSVTSIGEYAFYRCSGLTSASIGKSVTSIGKEAFSGCSALQTANIPDGIVTLPEKVFYGTALTEVSLPASVTSIGESCFGNTPTITKVVSLNTTPPEIKSSTFDSEVEEKAMLHVPKGSLVHYWLDPVWKEFANMSDDVLALDVIPDATYGDPEIDLAQFAPEGVELVYESSNSDVIEINGTMMRIVGAGEATVGAILTEEDSQMELMGQMRQFRVNKADLSVTVADVTIAQGQPLPDFSYMVEGLVYDDSVDDIEVMPQPLCDVTENSAPGEYEVEFTEGSDRNYEITTKPAKVTVTAAEPPVSNIDGIDSDNDCEIEVYDMKGIRLYKGPRSEAHLQKGFYLVRQGNAVAKVYVE